MFDSLGLKSIEMIADKLGLQDVLPVAWSSAKDSSNEGQVVAVADCLSVVSYLIEEHRMGNRTLDDVYIEVEIYLKQLRRKIQIESLKLFLDKVSRYFQAEINYD
jgi:hypothetical protein